MVLLPLEWLPSQGQVWKGVHSMVWRSREQWHHGSYFLKFCTCYKSEWKEHGFVVQAGQRKAYKGTIWVEAYSYIGSCERATHISWAIFVGRHEMDPIFSFSWATQFVVSPPLSHGVLMLMCWDSNFLNWSFCIPKWVDPLESCSWDGQWWGCWPGPSKWCQSKGSGTPCDCKTLRLCRCRAGLLDPSTCNYFLKMPQMSVVSVSLPPAHALKLQIIAPTANCHALLWTQFLLADDSQWGVMTGSYCYSRVLCEFL